MEALRISSEMVRFDVKADWICLMSVLRAYTDVEDLKQGKAVHGSVVKLGFDLEPDMFIALTAMYAKSGEVTVAKFFIKPNGNAR
ncbi:hypothetical protein MKX01_026651, partial [Papaver californicum]